MTRKYRPSELADKIEQAADILENSGWCRGVFKTPSGHFCLAGSLYEASGVRLEEPEPVLVRTPLITQQAVGVLDRAIAAEGAPIADAILWNDQQRDKRKVIRFMRRTARKLRAGKIHRTYDGTDRWVVS